MNLTPDMSAKDRGDAPIRVRKITLPFPADLPRHWFFGSPFATHMVNGLNLLFPLGERFFVRSVRKFVDRISDPLLLEQVKGFIGQEVRHGMEHERYFAVLEAQGFHVARFLRLYEAIAFEGIERVAPDKLSLAVTVALEHLTATFAERALSESLLDEAHPIMRDLLRWHAAEEIEHKSVAFDVLRTVDDGYALRVGGMAVAMLTLVPFWIAGTLMLLSQDEASVREIVAHLRAAQRRGMVRNGVMLRAFRDYLRRDFHPSDRDDAGLAKRFFAEAGPPFSSHEQPISS